ncbi:hypothetical protein Slin15195_G035690 [Septoria linicola]|uniref:Uncharacterized protein n=1 Tax=Septoria linicola TaxID=215465 RepID=A0A9Q9EGQ9_9PEZI|nr:hypothetical protein Slin14017_G117050 [Septoria linicola]USW50250.1 hypothetical protein Slin15195_G035690 [Septoria linicola]
MACDVGNSPFSASHLDDAWNKVEGSTSDLDAISDFNNTFDPQNSNTINPALTYSNPSTPQANNESAYRFNTAPGAELNQTFSPAPTYEAYPAPFNAAPASPYFHSIEVAGPVYQHSPLRNEQFGHRRSVSEPPGMPDQQPPLVFHRDEHWLGPSVRPRATPLKSQHKHKSHRSHPYPASARNPAKYQGHSSTAPQGADQHSLRPHVQRAYTQPVRQHAPTSAPMMSPQQFVTMSPQHLQQVNMHHHQPPAATPMPDQFHAHSTSRVCTPTPIDPSLNEPPTPTRSTKSVKKQTTLSIPMTVDELREMIYEAVQTAVGGASASKAVGDRELGAEGIIGGGDQIVPKAVQMEEAPDDDANLGTMKAEEGA